MENSSETQVKRTRTQEAITGEQIRASRALLPKLEPIADKLDLITEEIAANPVPYEPDDGASVMALSFATKQHEHLNSIRVLIGAGAHRDAHLIVRTMLEGLGRLLWAFNDRPARTDLWFWYGAILDWRRTKKNGEREIYVDPKEEEELRGYVEKHGPKYIRGSVRKEMARAERGGEAFELPEDPWTKYDWTEIDVATMFESLKARPLYDNVYRHSSEWIHWGPRSIFTALNVSEEGVTGFAREDWRAAAEAMLYGCLALLQSLEVVNDHFGLGLAPRLSSIDRRLVKTVRETMMSSDQRRSG